jgi:GT2 family glycosyltransferase
MDCSISTVVVAYRQRDVLIESLQACAAAAQRVPGGAELIVVDNGGVADLVREHCPSARVIVSGGNVGFAGGVNRGIAHASGRWIALVNDDARIEPDALAQALAAGERDRRVGGVATQVRFQSAPGVINSAGIEVDSLGVASERLAGCPIEAAQERCEVFGPTACFALYRRTMLDEIGTLDERFFAYLEDVDLAWRAQAAGWITAYEPGAVCYHRGSATTGEGTRQKYFLAGRNRVWLLARNATAGQLLRGSLGILAYDLAYVTYAAVRDRTLAPVRGRIAGMRGWRALRRERISRGGPVSLRPAARGWLKSLRMHRAYRRLGAQ